MQKQKPEKWIVMDNSTSPAHDWSVAKGLSFVEYHRIHGRESIGALRNRCIDRALELGAEYIVFWDDDDYYTPERISSGIEALEADPTADLAASSHMYLLLTKENVLMEIGPFSENHGTAATYTIRRRFIETHRFPDKSRGEEMQFTEEWKAKIAQVPGEKTMVVMGHSHNTINKSDIFKAPGLFRAKILNDVNGKMAVRTRWPIPWDIFRSTYVDGEYVRLRESIPPEPNYSVISPTPHTEETASFFEHRA